MISTNSGPLSVLVRYGAISEAARCDFDTLVPPARGAKVVVRTHRGIELGTVLEVLKRSPGNAEEPAGEFEIQQLASTDDLARHAALRARARTEFAAWEERIQKWKIDVQLVDLEWTLDESKLVLYVLNERGPECTKLAIQAVAAGFGIIEVQPVAADGPMTVPTGGGGGCGSCGAH